VPGQAEGGDGDEYGAALWVLVRSVLTLAGLVSDLDRAEDWATRRRVARVVDRYLVTVTANADALRSWLDLSSQRRVRPSAYRRRGGGS
jgi:hypothetical protein